MDMQGRDIMNLVKPPRILIKTWLDIYYSQTLTNNYTARTVVECRILEHFDSLYDAEMYLFTLDHLNFTD